MAQQTPSTHLFVIRPVEVESTSIARRLEEFGAVEKLPSTNMFVLRTPERGADPKEAWRGIHDALRDSGTAQPVLIDDAGQPHYPTGEISVRFHQSPSNEELARFAMEHRLHVRDRNRFMPQQVIFEVEDPEDHYLPTIIENIAKRDKVKTVWANTISRYKRI